MTLSPQDIVGKEFREAFRGYNQADVDLFLDEVVEEFTRVADENQKMKVRLAALQQEVARLRDAGSAAAAPLDRLGAAADPERTEAEVRARVRRFLEEQIRLIDAETPQRSATVERIARELPPTPEPTAEDAPAPTPTPKREPFWAGE
ncbi:MAG TPA: DivIVA domain-containing protein [Actinomycetota bacterium]